MDLRTHYPYWLLKHGIIRSYPSLKKNIQAEVAVIGGGISGALVAWHLAKAGIQTVVLEKRHIGMGSTVASTSLLQYEIDTPLHKLIKKVGEKNAVDSYLLCLEAIESLEKIAGKLDDNVGFERKPSFQYASFPSHVKKLEKEYQLRKSAGIKVKFLEGEEIGKKFGFRKEAGILSEAGASLDAYALTHALFADEKNNLQVYDHTEISGIHHHKKGVELVSTNGSIIKAKKLVIACGYESQKYIPFRVQELASTYAIISEPFDKKELWYKNALIWETATPYLYMRSTHDGRILMGGKDDDSSDPKKRDARLPAKTKALKASFEKLFPGIEFVVDFSWAGSFASTKDGLPFIGSIPHKPDTFFALGFGGNGITFSLLAAEIIRDKIKGKEHPGSGIFRFGR